MRGEVKRVRDAGTRSAVLANIDKLIAIVEVGAAEEVLAAMRNHPHGRQAQIIGTLSLSPQRIRGW